MPTRPDKMTAGEGEGRVRAERGAGEGWARVGRGAGTRTGGGGCEIAKEGRVHIHSERARMRKPGSVKFTAYTYILYVLNC